MPFWRWSVEFAHVEHTCVHLKGGQDDSNCFDIQIIIYKTLTYEFQNMVMGGPRLMEKSCTTWDRFDIGIVRTSLSGAGFFHQQY